MPAKADTIAVLVTATSVPCPTDMDDQVAVINIGANNVWVCHTPDVAATVEGDNNECILPGTATVLQWMPAPKTYSMIAETGTTDINIVNRMGR